MDKGWDTSDDENGMAIDLETKNEGKKDNEENTETVHGMMVHML